jgi:hypothetical protein
VRDLLHAGTAYKLAPDQQIDFHAAVGLSAAALKSYVGLGYSYFFLTRRVFRLQVAFAQWLE